MMYVMHRYDTGMVRVAWRAGERVARTDHRRVRLIVREERAAAAAAAAVLRVSVDGDADGHHRQRISGRRVGGGECEGDAPHGGFGAKKMNVIDPAACQIR